MSIISDRFDYTSDPKPPPPGSVPDGEVLRRGTILIGIYFFECPYCGRTFERGGHKEGFVKSGALNHTFSCWEATVFVAGWWTVAWGYLGPARREDDPYHWRRLKALVAARRRDGVDINRIVERFHVPAPPAPEGGAHPDTDE